LLPIKPDQSLVFAKSLKQVLQYFDRVFQTQIKEKLNLLKQFTKAKHLPENNVFASTVIVLLFRNGKRCVESVEVKTRCSFSFQPFKIQKHLCLNLKYGSLVFYKDPGKVSMFSFFCANSFFYSNASKVSVTTFAFLLPNCCRAEVSQ